MRPWIIAGAIVALALSSLAPARAQLDIINGKPLMTLENQGLTMSQQEALERITFQPFVPTTTYIEVALLPSFHGDDKDHPENRGIGYEYTDGAHTYVLRQWPKAGGSLDKYPATRPVGSCTDVHVILGSAQNPHGIGWATQTLVFALQPDPPQDTRQLHAEFVRLVQHGACR